MAIDTKKNAGELPKKSAAMDMFDKAGGTEIFTDRPIVDWDELGDAKLPVQGWLVCEEALNLPKGVKRIDPITKQDVTTWDAFVFHLTATTKAMKDGEIVDVIAGREVYVAVNPKTKILRKYLYQAKMNEIIILGEGKIPVAGKQDMQNYRIKATGNEKVREGAFLVGGPGQLKALREGSIDSTLGQIENAVNGQPQHAAP